MKKSLLLFLLLMLPAGQLLYAQVYAEDYNFPAKGKHYYRDDAMYTVWKVGAAELHGALDVYTDHPEYCHYPLVVHFGVKKPPVNGAICWFGFWITALAGTDMPFMEYCKYFGYTRDIWEYRVLYTMLKNCGDKVKFEIEPHVNHIEEEAFLGTLSLEQVQINLYHSVSYERSIIGKGAFRDCPDLKYVTFDSPVGSVNQDVFLGCPSLEVIRFCVEVPDPNNMRHMFHTNWDCTGSYYYPNLKAIVVPDNYRDRFPNFDTDFADKVCRAVKEGHTKIMTESEFKFKTARPESLTISQSTDTLPIKSSHQLTATVSPSNVSNKNVIWSSDRPSVVEVSSTGVITAKEFSKAIITATLEMDNRYTDSCTVTVPFPADYGCLRTLSVVGHNFPGGFNANIHSHSLAVSYSTGSINIAAEAIDYPGVTVTGTGTKTLLVGDTVFSVTVHSGSIFYADRTYTINVHRKSNDASFKFLTAGGSALPLTSFTHNITVPNATGTFNITAEANHSLASVSGIGNKTLNEGDNPFTVTSTAEDGNTLTHTINVHRRSVDGTLGSFTLTDTRNSSDIPFGFNPATLNYSVPVSNSVSSIMVAAAANYHRATVTGDTGNKTLNVGDNRFTVTVTPEEGLPKTTYTVTVYRRSADETLQSLTLSTLNGSNIHMEYNPEKLTYTATVPVSVKNITLNARANHSAAFVTGHTGIQSLRPGRNIFHITVTSEDGAVKTYPVVVHVVSNVIIQE